MRPLLPLLVLSLVATPVGASNGSTEEVLEISRLETLVNQLEGGDTRLVRWDAARDTGDRQEANCSDLTTALDMLLHADEASTQMLICEYASFCITDNPRLRERFSSVKGVHQVIVSLINHPSPVVSAAASQVVYHAAFGDTKNHKLFYQASVVPALTNVIRAYSNPNNSAVAPVQAMWAAAALQNMAASYCDTEDDSRCYWGWYDQEDYVVVLDDSQPLVSSGNPTRRDVETKYPDVVHALLDIVCTQGPSNDELHKFPGEDAIAGVDDSAPNIVTWAAAGAIKNLVLRNEIVPLVQDRISCFCRLHESEDWLESSKAGDVLQRLRRDDEPCHYDETDEQLVCVDKYFYSEDGLTCGTLEDCEAVDQEDGVKAKDACCLCGGGDRLVQGVAVDGEGDLYKDDEVYDVDDDDDEDEEEVEKEESDDEDDDDEEEADPHDEL